MLAELKQHSFRELVKNASKEELIWMNGYISAMVNLQSDETIAAPELQQASPAFSNGTIVYGTESGNSKKLAFDIGNKLKQKGVQPKIKSLDQYRLSDLQKESLLLVVISTQGEGEPPAAAKKFYDHIHQSNASLSNLSYGVLALGDSSYPLFCKAGEDVDERFAQLGASRIVDVKKCDTDFEADANEWMDSLLRSVSGNQTPAITKPVVKAATKTGKKWYNGAILTSVNLNDTGSLKETFHIEIGSDEAIVYQPGDSLGIVPYNKETNVLKVLQLLNLQQDDAVVFNKENYAAKELFTRKINIIHLPERVVQNYARLIQRDIPSVRIDLADLLRIYPAENGADAQQIINVLEAITPRLYSISSSPLAHGENEIHITVARNCYEINDQKQHGLCSDYLSFLDAGDGLDFYIHKNNAFRLPEEDKDVIMIGPGTGVAPFRSFLLEREAQSASGKNWLFFGDQHFVSDFLYQTELQSLMQTNVLTNLSTAFSRDQKEKIYVQHKMQKHADELFNWIESGAQIYVCGSLAPMSVDVENTLVDIIASKKNTDRDGAQQYINNLKEAGRYHKDVY